MENKILLLVLLLLFSMNMVIFAKGKSKKPVELKEQKTPVTQTEEKTGNDSDVEEENTVQWQTLEWDEEDPDYVTKYQIVIEKYDDGTQSYVELQTVETSDNSTSVNIEPQLGPGIYRYKIITYDLFYMPSIESEWNPLTIYRAFDPKVSGITSLNFTQTIYLEEYNDGIFNISGQNLFMPPEDEYSTSHTKYLLKSKKDSKNQKSHDEAKTSYVPEILEHDENNKKLKVYFDPQKLEVGKYHFSAEDASGLTSENTSSNEITVKFKKPLDLNVSVGYEAPYVLYDSTFMDYFGYSIWPLSATAKISLIPIKKRAGFFGFQLQGEYSRLQSTFDSYSIDGNIISGHGNFVYQFPIYVRVSGTQRRHIMTLEAHGGVGATYLQNFVFHFENDIESDPLNSLNISVDAGLAMQIFITSNIYAEIQADYVNAFMSDMMLGTVVPVISVGWQF